jgi:hypothetical protein
MSIASQFPGSELNARTWESDLLAPRFPESCYVTGEKVLCNPRNIIECFSNNAMLEGLALTVGWGGMARTKNKIYERGKHAVENELRECARAISQSKSIEHAWRRLVGNLGWSDVISSKTLHFMCRALGYEQNPGVAIDTAVIIEQFGYHYDDCMWRIGGDPRELGYWRDRKSVSGSWEMYNRYMTAICCWAEMQGWSTTQVEATIFAHPDSFLG